MVSCVADFGKEKKKIYRVIMAREGKEEGIIGQCSGGTAHIALIAILEKEKGREREQCRKSSSCMDRCVDK